MIDFINVLFQILFYWIIQITGLDPYEIFVMLMFTAIIMSITASLGLMISLMYVIFDFCVWLEQKQDRRS